jgi:bifunctional non-homologous end joining protein LigD
MALSEYRKKRRFERTSEPTGKEPLEHGRRFVVQMHAASHLHYDFRLELDGVLKSWAVPKGPSLDPSERRLAMQTEDHPLAYADFEGIIPAGEYGGGTVLLWDRGVWVPLGPASRDLAKGTLRFLLFGEKLGGAFVLARDRDRDRENAWRLTKEPDDAAVPVAEGRVTETGTESVATGRSLDEVARDRDRTWRSNRGRGHDPERKTRPAEVPRLPRPRPELPDKKTKVPRGDAFLHEIAADGERLLIVVEGGRAALRNDRGRDRTAAFPSLVDAAERLGLGQVVLDGVVTHLLPDGTTSAAGLGEEADDPDTLVHYAFDLLSIEGKDLGELPLEVRKARLHAVLTALAGPSSALRYADHVVGSGELVFEKACALSATGVLSKRRDAAHRGGKSDAWTFVPCRKQRAARTRSPSLVLSNPDRVMYPDVGLTKADLAAYYADVARFMVPHVVGRPLTLVRCPDGMSGECLYMRHSRVWSPPGLRKVSIQEKTKVGEYLIADDAAGLLALVQMDILEIHTWNSDAADVDRPNRIVIDLDPDEGIPFSRVVEGARLAREILASVGLDSFVKTTGGKGLHVVAPLVPRAAWDECFAFSRKVAQAMVRTDPSGFTTQMPKARRKGKILIDYLRNNRTNTSIAAFSTRARAGAPVSVPVRWNELDDLAPPGFDVHSVRRRLSRLRRDPWKESFDTRQLLDSKTARALE